MTAFSNDRIKDNLCGGCECTGFTAAVDFVYNAGAKTIVFTDNSTYAAGDARKIVNLQISDKNCDKVDANISAADGDDAVTASVAALDLSEGFIIKATVVSTNGCISDGHAGRLGMLIATGSIGSWDKDSTTISIADIDDDES